MTAGASVGVRVPTVVDFFGPVFGYALLARLAVGGSEMDAVGQAVEVGRQDHRFRSALGTTVAGLFDNNVVPLSGTSASALCTIAVELGLTETFPALFAWFDRHWSRYVTEPPEARVGGSLATFGAVLNAILSLQPAAMEPRLVDFWCEMGGEVCPQAWALTAHTGLRCQAPALACERLPLLFRRVGESDQRRAVLGTWLDAGARPAMLEFLVSGKEGAGVARRLLEQELRMMGRRWEVEQLRARLSGEEEG